MPDLIVKTLTLAHMPRKPVWTRLGFREQTSAREEILPTYEPILNQFIAETQVRLFYIEKPYRLTDGQIDLEGYRFTSHLVRERFGNASAAWVMGASARPEDVARIHRLHETGDLQRAVILDAVLSEKADFGLDFIEQEAAVVLRRSGRTLGRRLSCGYGDFSLEHQKFFYNTLAFDRYGIRISDRNILEPEKTVTALLPIYSGDSRHE